MSAAEPYIGLRPFEREDSEIFFGRDQLVSELMERLRQSPFVAVLGLSGEGKSSLVRAGLIPALDAGYLDYKGIGWTVATMTPGVNPLRALATALSESEWGKNFAAGHDALFARLSAGPGALTQVVRESATKNSSRLLIVVDQFEELFTRDDKRDANVKADTRLFVAQLLDASFRSDKRVYVLVTMRSEFLGHCAEYASLAHAITRGVFLVPRMRDSELAEAIEMPVRLFKGEVEAELTRQLVDQLKGDTTLPVLQHLLMRMWRDEEKERKDKEASKPRSQSARAKGQRSRSEEGLPQGPRLTREFLSSFDEPGDALDSDLEEAYLGNIEEKRTAEHQRATEAIFRRITKQTGWNERKQRYEYARDPATVAEIAQVAGVKEEEIYAVVNAFRKPGRTFLKASGKVLGPDSLIDLTHEAVINNWTRAQEWAADEAENARQFQQLREWAARARRDGEYTPDALLKGSDLGQKSRWFDDARVRFGGPPLSARWAARYTQSADPSDSESALMDFEGTIKFLKESRARGDREQLRVAIKEGNLNEVADFVERGVRLTKDLLTRSESAEYSAQSSGRWDFASHYYAAVPERDADGDQDKASVGESLDRPGEERSQAQSMEAWLAECFPKEGLDRSALDLVRVQHYAAWGGDMSVLKALKDRGLSFTVQTERELSPLHVALMSGRLEAAKMIYAEIGGTTALINKQIEKQGKATVLHLVIREWAKARARARSAERSKDVTTRYQAVLGWLLSDLGVEVNTTDNNGASPVHWAVQNDNGAALKMLVGRAELNVQEKVGRTPLFIAASLHRGGLVETLVSGGANVRIADNDGVTPLLACLQTSGEGPAYSTVRLLLDNSADAKDVNPFTSEGTLHLTLGRSDIWGETNSLLTALVEKGARIDIRDDKERTPMSLALDKAREDVAVYFFLKRHGTGEGEVLYGEWMVQAVRANARELIQEMLDHGIKPDLPDAKKDTALHVAASEGDASLLIHLLVHADEFNIDVGDEAGQSPLRRALIADKQDCANILADWDAATPAYLNVREFKAEAFEKIKDELTRRLSGSANADWKQAVMMPGAWRNLDAEEAAAALYRVFEAEKYFLAQVPADRIDAVRALDVRFLKNAKLCEARLSQEGGELKSVLFMVHEGGATWLTGSAPSRLLARMGNLMDFSEPEQVRDYVFVNIGANFWDRGVLSLVEAPDDACLNTALPPGLREKVAAVAGPLVLHQDSGDVLWVGDGVAQYGEDLWRLHFEIKPGGELLLNGVDADVHGLPFVHLNYKSGRRALTLPNATAS